MKGGLWIGENSVLTSLDGLVGITSIGSNLLIQNNGVLNRVDGLSDLSYVGSSLEISQNETLCQDDAQAFVDGIATVRGAVTITDNAGGCD